MTNTTVIPKSKSFVYLSFHLYLYRRYLTTSKGSSTLVATTINTLNSKSPTNPLFVQVDSLTADGTAPVIQNILHSEAEEIRAQCMYPSANFGVHVVITSEIFCITVVQEIRKQNGTGIVKYDTECLPHPSSYIRRLATFIPSDHRRTNMKEEGL